MIGYFPPTYAEDKKRNATPRMYFRCHDCLTVLCTTDQPAHIKNSLTCGICGGRMIWMGDVKENRYYHTHEECVCNEKCQNATGPKCTCACGGDNHGKSFLYKVVVDGSGVVIEHTGDDRDKRLAIAAEYRSSEADALARIRALPHYNDYCNHVWIDRADWLRINDAINALNEARKGSMQKSRIKKLEKVAK